MGIAHVVEDGYSGIRQWANSEHVTWARRRRDRETGRIVADTPQQRRQPISLFTSIDSNKIGEYLRTMHPLTLFRSEVVGLVAVSAAARPLREPSHYG